MIILGDYLAINEGDEVRSTGRLLSVPVGDAVLGRVIDPLGNPLDGERPDRDHRAPAGRSRSPPAWPSASRSSEPLQTGIKAIDAMTPIGRGQRELIIGDRKTGKTAICIDTIINQKDTGVKCFYVAIGQKESTVAGADRRAAQARGDGLHHGDRGRGQRPGPAAVHRPLRRLRDGRVLHVQGRARADRLRRPLEAGPGLPAVVAADAAPAGPRGLSRRHLLLPQPPAGAGGQAVSDELGGGSLTALPIVETLEGEVSAYIPTNVISITDGQIYLQPDLFFAGQRPAMNVGISVSRVGGAAQVPAMKKVAGGLRLDLASFRELEAFAQLGTDLDAATQARLDRGYRMTELLKQGLYQPMHVTDQVLSIYAGTRGHLDKVPRRPRSAWEKDFLQFIHERRTRPAGRRSPTDSTTISTAELRAAKSRPR